MKIHANMLLNRLLSSMIGCILVLTGCTTPVENSSDFIWVEDFDLNSIAATHVKYKLVRNGDVYEAAIDPWARQANRDPFGVEKVDPIESNQPAITVQELQSLREGILKAPQTSEGLLEAYGITSESIASKRDMILHHVVGDHWKLPGGELPVIPPEIEKKLTYDVVSPHLLAFFTGTSGWSTSNVKYLIVLPGDPKIKLETFCYHPGLMPFTVTVEEESWKVFDPSIFPLLRKLFSPYSPFDQTIREADAWRKGVLTDMLSFWFSAYVGVDLDQHLSKQFFQNLNGYEDEGEVFEFEKASSGNFYPYGLSVSFDLKVKKHGSIQKVSWYIPLDQEPPEKGIGILVENFQVAENLLSKHQYIQNWQQVDEERSVRFRTKGERGYTDNLDDYKEYILTAWKQAEFKGMPEYQISLYGKQPTKSGVKNGHVGMVADVYLGSEEDRILILDLRAGENPWGVEDKFFITDFNAPRFGIATPEGTFTSKPFQKRPAKDGEP